MSKGNTSAWRRTGRWSLLGVAWLGVLALAGIVWFKTVLPGWAATQIQRQLAGLGFTATDVVVENCSLSGVTLSPLRVASADGRWLAADSVRVHFSPGGLLARRVDGITVSGLTVDVVQTGTGWQVPVLAPLLQESASPALPRPATAQDVPWQCDRLELRGASVSLISGTATVPLAVEVAVDAPAGSPIMASGEVVTGSSRLAFRARVTRDGRGGVCQLRSSGVAVRELLAILERTALLPKPAAAVDATLRGQAQGRWRDGRPIEARVSVAADDLTVALPSAGGSARGGFAAQAHWEPEAGALTAELTGWMLELAAPGFSVDSPGAERPVQLQLTAGLALPTATRPTPALQLTGTLDLAPALLAALAPAAARLTTDTVRIPLSATAAPLVDGTGGWSWQVATPEPVWLPAVLVQAPPALLTGELRVTGAAAGRTDTGEIRGSLEARLGRLNGWLPGMTFGASELVLMAGVSQDRDGLRAAGYTTLNDGWVSHSSGLQVRGISALLPAAWNNREGAGASGLAADGLDTTGVVEVGAAHYRNLLLHGTVGTAWTGPGLLGLEAAFAGEGLPDLRAHVSVATSVTPALTATFAISPWSFTQQSPALALAGQLPADLTLAGVLTASGTCQADGMGLRSSLTFGLKDGEVALAKQDLRVTGIQTSLSLPALPALASAAHQQLTFTSASVMGMPVEAGTLSFQLESPDRWFVEQAAVNWCGGILRTYALALDFARDDYDMVIFADRVELPRLLALIKDFDGRAAGTLYGRLPLRIRKGRVYFQDGFLYAVPGQPGFVALKDTTFVTGPLAQAGTDPETLKRLGSALQDLGFSLFKLDLAGEGGKDTVLRFHLAGASRKDPALPPVDLTFNIRGPLGQLLNLGVRLQSMGGKDASDRK